MKKKLILLSGPSCVGKGPLRKALEDFHPEIGFAEPVWIHSRKPRFKRSEGRYEVHGVDYYFSPRGMVELLPRDRFLVGDLGYGLQAMDLAHLEEMFDANDVVFTEMSLVFQDPLADWVKRQARFDIEVRHVMLVPMTLEEVERKSAETGAPPEQVVYEVMIGKQRRRGEDPPEKMERRARAAYPEMKAARPGTKIIVCRAGEDDLSEWGRPLGPEARRVLGEFVKVFVE